MSAATTPQGADVELGFVSNPTHKKTYTQDDIVSIVSLLHKQIKRDLEAEQAAEQDKTSSHIKIADDFPHWWSPHTWIDRMRNSSFVNLLYGSNVNISEIDNVVNTLALVNALVLTIPFSLIMSLSFDYWDNIDTLTQGCSSKMGFSYDFVLNGIRSDFITVIYGSIMALVLILLYYLTRPRNDDALFKRWWRTSGNKMFVALCILTVAGIVALLTLATHLLKYSMVRRESFCNFPNVAPSQVAYGFLVSVVFFALVIMV